MPRREKVIIGQSHGAALIDSFPHSRQMLRQGYKGKDKRNLDEQLMK
jgi:hypothetical protein